MEDDLNWNDFLEPGDDDDFNNSDNSSSGYMSDSTEQSSPQVEINDQYDDDEHWEDQESYEQLIVQFDNLLRAHILELDDNGDEDWINEPVHEYYYDEAFNDDYQASDQELADEEDPLQVVAEAIVYKTQFQLV